MACKSLPPAADQYPVEGVEEAVSSGSFTISQEVYDATLAEVKLFVDDLNSLIMKKDYNGWKVALADEFLARISSPEFLATASESAALKSRRIVLKTPTDYFLQVVVPSRSNSRVDEIEFTAIDRVKVFYREERVRKVDNTSTTEVRRLRLYELKKTDDIWKIID
jgi:hypothetical protein